MSEFILTEADVSDNKKFSGDEKADDQDFIDKEDFTTIVIRKKM